MNTQFKIVLFWMAVIIYNPCSAVPIPIEQEDELLADNNTGRQIQNILDIPQQVASFIGNALFPTTPTTTARATTEEATLPTRRASVRNTPTKEPSTAAPAPVTPRIKYVYVTPPPPRVVIVKPRPFAPAITQPPATEAPAVTEPTTEAVEGGDEDEDTEEEGI